MSLTPDRLLLAAFAALSCAIAVPLWLPEYLPFLDIPQHLMTIAVMHHLDDPEFGFAAYYTVEAGSTQYLLYYLTCDLLSNVAGVDVASRIFITLYLVALPWSVLLFLRAFGRIEAAALLAFPLAYNKFLFMGFINYVFALPFFFAGLGLAKRALDSERTCRWRQAGLAVLAVVLFYSHLQVFILYVGALGLFGLMHWRGPLRLVTQLLHLTPALSLFAWWAFASDGLAGGEAWDAQVSHRYAALTGSLWEPLATTLKDAPERLMAVYRDSSDELLTVAVLSGILILLLLRRSGRSLEDHAPEVLTLFVVGFYLAVPSSYKWIWPVNWRFLPVAAILALAWGRRDLGPGARSVLTIAFAAIAAWSISVHARHFRAFDEEAKEFAPILEEVEPGARVMSLIFDSTSSVIQGPAYLHFGQYHPLRQGGVSVYSFAEAPQSPIRFRLQRHGGPPPTPLRSEWKPHEFRWGTDARFYDYFLVRGNRPGWFHRARFPRAEVKKVVESGKWVLYRYDRS